MMPTLHPPLRLRLIEVTLLLLILSCLHVTLLCKPQSPPLRQTAQKQSQNLPPQNQSSGSKSLTHCPGGCLCTHTVPPSNVPKIWDIPSRLPKSPHGKISLSMSCVGTNLTLFPPFVVPSDVLSSRGKKIDVHHIVELDISRNNIQELLSYSFKNYKELRSLKCSHNQIQNISSQAFTSNNKLKSIFLDHNSLHSLPSSLVFPPQLHELDLSGNVLTFIPEAVEKILTLRSLNMAHNRLGSIQDSDLSSLPRLETLLLGSNRIITIHPQSFAALPSLQILDLKNNQLTSVPHAVLLCPSIENLYLANNMITALNRGVLSGLVNLQSVSLQGNPISNVHPTVFTELPQLTSIILQEITRLESFPLLSGCDSLLALRIDRSAVRRVPDRLCTDVPVLRSLNLHHNELSAVPQLQRCLQLKLLDLSHNSISELPENGLLNQENLQDLLLHNNRITTLHNGAFNGLTNLQTLNLEFNLISTIEAEAFLPLVHLRDINLGNNELTEFPEEGLERISTLKVHHNKGLKVFPGIERFPFAHTLVLSYAYHCCPFLGFDGERTEVTEPPKIFEDVIYNMEDMQAYDSSLLMNMTNDWQGLDGDLWENFWKNRMTVNDADSSTLPAPTMPKNMISCIPKPGPFMPCRDLFDWWTLRCGVWIVFLLALLGNGTVVFVLCFARTKMDVPRFLVTNLAAADFCMGVYLGFLAVVDASTLGEFRMYAIPWQMSSWCQVAGFVGVMSSELSVFTLTVITLERNYAITHAMHLNKRLSLRHAAYVMVGGWAFAATMAVLPITGISDYRKFAICLPFETEGAGLSYVVIIMFINGVCFLILMICYMKIYCSIRGSQAWNSNDSRIAKRMALLVFTDFICLAPIAFFSLTAAFGLHLITLEGAKVFTVFVLPFNSCCNPFLYALLTKQFKKDCILLCKSIEESRVTRGIGRCRHSSNFSNRHTPVNTNSAVDQSSKTNGSGCNCQEKKKKRKLIDRIRVPLRKFFHCPRRQATPKSNTEYNFDQERVGTNIRNTSLSSEAYSSSYSENNWRKNRMPLSLRLLERKGQNPWFLTRKPSEESNLSSSRNDSTATTASTSTWRISRSSVSSDISSAGSRVFGKTDSQLSFKLGSFRERRKESRGRLSPTIMPLQQNPNKAKPKLLRQTAVEKETYVSNKLSSEIPKACDGDNLSCVYEQDSFEEDEMTQVSAFLTPTYKLAGLAVGFLPRKLSTISSNSLSINKEMDSSMGDVSNSAQIFAQCDYIDDTEGENGTENLRDNRLDLPKIPKSSSSDSIQTNNSRKYKRCPSEGFLSTAPVPDRRYLMRRFATMPTILAPEEGLTGDPQVPEKLLETHFPVEEPPDEQHPLL